MEKFTTTREPLIFINILLQLFFVDLPVPVCECSTSFLVDHAMACPYGGFPTIRHNEVHDLTATLLTEVAMS